MSLDRDALVNPRLTVALVLQVVGYAALLAVYPHSEPSAVVESLRWLPAAILAPFALPAIPALALTLAVGAVLSLVGLSPGSIPALLLARGDVLFFACAYLVAVASVWVNRRARELAP